mmetsp:Transcript_47034/g.106537  ORF Transcript_47034/g.106537 Transcript_47034/m.106537 type:complete len:299 (-) Transcript_47034:1732-2628(-)
MESMVLPPWDASSVVSTTSMVTGSMRRMFAAPSFAGASIMRWHSQWVTVTSTRPAAAFLPASPASATPGARAAGIISGEALVTASRDPSWRSDRVASTTASAEKSPKSAASSKNDLRCTPFSILAAASAAAFCASRSRASRFASCLGRSWGPLVDGSPVPRALGAGPEEVTPRDAILRGHSFAAHKSWARNTCWFSRGMTAASGGRAKSASGSRAKSWSRGLSNKIMMAKERRPARPARPDCWRRLETEPGNPKWSVASSEPTSMPSSSALVAVTPRRRHEKRSASSARRSSLVYPPR